MRTLSVDPEVPAEPSLETFTEEPATAVEAPPSASPRIRGQIAVVVTRFPRLEETYVLREIGELERRGQPLVVIPIMPAHQAVTHEEAKPWSRRALVTPFISRAVAAANFRVAVRRPRQYFAVLTRIVIASLLHPAVLIRMLALFPKAIHLSRLLPERGIRHVHAHGALYSATLAWIISRLGDVTYSFTVYGPDVFEHRVLLRRKIEDAAFIRTVSIFNKAFLTGLYPAAAEGKIHVIYSGVKPEIYAAAARAVRYPRRPLIVTVSAPIPALRGLSFLIDACAELKRAAVDFDCRIVGATSPADPLRDRVEELGLSEVVHFVGPQPQHEVARIIGEADVFVLPSVITPTGQMDGIPLSLVEAMAAGKPVVASAISGIPEIVRHGINGLLVDSTHPEQIAAAIGHLLNDESLRRRLGEQGQRSVSEHFDIRRTGAELVGLLDRATETNEVALSTERRIRSLDWSRLRVVALGVRKIYDLAESSVAEVTITDGIQKRDVIVRRHRESSDARVSAYERARTEFEALSILADELRPLGSDGDDSSTVCLVPPVLMFDEEQASLVVGRADGKSLAGMLGEIRSTGAPRQLLVALRRTGQWLTAMQRQTENRGEVAATLARRRAAALDHLELAAAADAAVGRQFAALAALLRNGCPECDESLRVAGRHGNFSPSNIFVAGQHVTVTDFGRYGEGLPLDDVARFLIELELAVNRPFGWRSARRLRQAFLEGWMDGRDTGVSDTALRFFTTMNALQMLAHGDEETNPVRAWRRRRALLRILERGLPS